MTEIATNWPADFEVVGSYVRRRGVAKPDPRQYSGSPAFVRCGLDVVFAMVVTAGRAARQSSACVGKLRAGREGGATVACSTARIDRRAGRVLL